jgi:hypothetical protein
MCLLQDTPFDQSKTKAVHKACPSFKFLKFCFLLWWCQIILNGLPWVAKRFINIGTGEGQVEIQENHEQVVKEVGRLSRLAYFLQRFVAEAQRKGVDIDQGQSMHSCSHVAIFEPEFPQESKLRTSNSELR